MRLRLVIFGVLLMTACSGNATSPSTTSGGGLSLQASPYVVELFGGSEQCGDIKVPQAGTSVSFVVMLRA